LGFHLLELVRVRGLVTTSPSVYIRFKFGVQGNYAGSSESQIVLQGDFSDFNLPLVGHIAKLPAEFSTLSKSCSSQWVSLRNQPTAWVNYDAAAEGKFVSID